MKNFTQKFKAAILCLLTFFSVSFFSNAQETCATAVPVTDLTGVVCATGSPGSVDNMAAASCGGGTLEAFYSFIAQGPNATINVTSSVSGFRPEFVVMESSDNTCSGLFSYYGVNCFDGVGNYTSLTGNATLLVPGKKYWVLISSGKAVEVTTGTLTVCITNPPVPVNDLCSAATVVTPDGTCYPGTTVGASDNLDGTTYYGCQTGNNAEVWYSFVSTGTTADFTITNGTMTGNVEVVLIANTCTGGIVETHCAGSPYAYTFHNLTPGTTYFYTVSSSTGSLGTFTTCVNTYTPPAISGQDCSTALLLCSNATINEGVSNAGYGIQEVDNNNSCLAAGERQSKWYKFTAANNGTLEFNIHPNVLTDDYDWAIWDITTQGCPSLSNPTHTSLACNWDGATYLQSTGMSSCPNICASEPDAQDCSPSAGCQAYCFQDWMSGTYTPLTLTAGHSYVIVVDNFLNSNSGYTMTFGGACGGGSLIIGPDTGFSYANTGTCGSFQFTKTINTPNSTYQWFFGDGSSSTLQNPTHVYTVGGTYTVFLTVTDALGCSKTTSQTIVLPIANAGSDVTICSGASSVIGAASTGGYTYLWSPTTGLSSSTISNPSITLTNLTAVATTNNYIVTATSGGYCMRDTVVVTVEPNVTVTNATLTQAICSGSTATFTPTSGVVGSTFAWTAVASAGTITGFTTSGTGNISDIISNSASTSGTVTYTITPTGPAPSFCVGTPVNFVVTVNPIPTVTNATLTQTICSGSSASFTPTSGVASTTFAWTASLTSGTVTGFSATGTGNISNVLTNATAAVGSVTYVITPTGPGTTFCVGTPVNFVVTVNPLPSFTVAGVSPSTCNGTDGTITLSGLSNSTAYNITYVNGVTSVGPTLYTSSPTGDILISGLSAGTYTPFTAQLVSTGCSKVVNTSIPLSNPGAPNVFDITDVVQCAGTSYTLPTITGTTLTGSEAYYDAPGNTGNLIPVGTVFTTDTTIYIYDESGICNDQEVFTITFNLRPTVTNATLTQVICSGSAATFTPTSGVASTTFAWTASLTSGTVTGFSASGTGNISNVLTNSTTTAGAVTYVITPTGPAPTSCVGTPVNFVVTVNPIPAVTNATLTQAICSGSAATFTPTSGVASTTFAWTASLTSGTVTGFSASGTGNISNVLTNSTATSGTVTYVITPTGPATTLCVGTPVNFVVTVNPIPTVTNATLTQSICSGSTATFTPTSGVASTTYAWTASLTTGTVTGFSASGTGNISNVLTNSTSAPGSVTYVITPTGPAATSCVGTPVNFVVTVNPIPTVTNATLTQAICSGSSATFVPTSGVASTTYAWTASLTTGTVTGFSANGTGNISNVLTNSTSAPGTVTYVITPTGPAATSCVGTPLNFVVTVNPIPTVTNATLTQAICSGSSATFVPTSGVASTTYAWTASLTTGTVTGFSANGTGNISNVLTNSTSATGTVTYVITPTGPASTSCVGTPVNFVVTVNPIPTLSNTPTTQSICSGGSATYTPTSAVAGTTFPWTASLTAGTVTGFSPSGIASISEVLTNSTSNLGTVTYIITPTGPAPSACVGTPVNLIVNVNALGNPAFTFADYCESAVNAPVITGDLGGTFSFNPAVTDGATINASSGVIQNGIGGTQYTVQYVVTCLATLTENVFVKPIPSAPTVSGLPTSSLCNNTGSPVLTAVGNGGSFTWADNSSTIVSTTNNYSPSVINGIQQYSVYETLLGCQGPSTSISIEFIACEIAIPTAITPDGNQIDDKWELKDIDVIFPNNVVSIYNRWGALLYKSEKGAYSSKEWDGKYNGEDLPVASYYFIIEYNDDNMKNSTGTVSIIRK